MEGDSDEDALMFEDETSTWAIVAEALGETSLPMGLEVEDQRALVHYNYYDFDKRQRKSPNLHF